MGFSVEDLNHKIESYCYVTFKGVEMRDFQRVFPIHLYQQNRAGSSEIAAQNPQGF